MHKGRKLVVWYGRVYLVVLLLLMTPACTIAGIQLNLEWDPNPEPHVAGYRVFSREAGQDYDYGNPVWEGEENICSIFVDDEEGVYLYVVRAFNEGGFESDDSNEVIYSDYNRYLNGSGSSSGGGCFIGALN